MMDQSPPPPDGLFAKNIGAKTMNIARTGETFANVSIVDGRVHIYFPLSDSYLNITANGALELARLLKKYAREATVKS